MKFTQTSSQTATSSNMYNLTNEQLLAGREHLVNSFVNLMSHGNRDTMYWLGTQTDLIEIVYLIYRLRVVRNQEGNPCTFHSLVRQACALLHMPMPYNPSCIAQRAISRKGIKTATMVERYAWKKCVAGVENPLKEEIREKETV